MNLKKTILIAAISFTSLNLWSQCENKLTAKADFAYSTNSFGSAIELYDKAMGKAGKDKELKNCIMFQIARCHLHLNDYKAAEKNFKKIVKVASDPLVHYEYGQLLKSQQRYEEAKGEFDTYTQKVPNDPRGPMASKSCETAISYMKNPTCYKVENMKVWNSGEHDFAPIIGDKKNETVYFASNRQGSLGKENTLWSDLNEDIWFSELDKKKKWSTPEPVPVVSTMYSEGSGDMDKKFSTLYFTRCFGIKKGDKEGTGCRIFSAKRVGDKWEEAILIPLFPDTFVTIHPTVDATGKYMVFSSNAPEGSFGGMDLYIATYNKKEKTFTNPKNLGNGINTEFHEMYPYLKADNTLYFSSDKPVGMGGFDIYVAPKLAGDKMEWKDPENMEYPMNSEADDFGITFISGQEAGYFSSNRKGGKGDDIYSFTTPLAKIILSGTVRDKDTKAPIADATVSMIDGAGNKFDAKTDATGFYKKEIPFGVSYEMEANKQDYYKDINKASTAGLDPLRVCNDTNIVADFLLKTQKVDLEFEIQFVFDKPEFFPEYKDSVDVIYQILKDNPTMVAEIGGHTDSRGSDTYNAALSDKRANYVVEYLIGKGIAKERLIAKGYGESEARVLHTDFIGTESKFVFKKDTKLTEEYINSLNDGTEEGKKKFEDAHRLNRRLSMKKISDAYKVPVVVEDDKED